MCSWMEHNKWQEAIENDLDISLGHISLPSIVFALAQNAPMKVDSGCFHNAQAGLCRSNFSLFVPAFELIDDNCG